MDSIRLGLGFGLGLACLTVWMKCRVGVLLGFYRV